MRIKFTYYNAKKMTLISEIDGVEAGCRISGSEPTACVELDVPTGQHVLTVTKRTWYDSPLCFLNIINPIFYLWQLKFFDHRDLYNSERFSSVAVSFDVNENPENALMVLKLEPNGAAESTEMLCSAVHTENVDVRSISKARSRVVSNAPNFTLTAAFTPAPPAFGRPFGSSLRRRRISKVSV